MSNSNLPSVSYVPANLPGIVDEVETYLIDADYLGVYQRDGKLVRIGHFPLHGSTPSLEFVPVAHPTLV